jgi:hypothetical protein
MDNSNRKASQRRSTAISAGSAPNLAMYFAGLAGCAYRKTNRTGWVKAP